MFWLPLWGLAVGKMDKIKPHIEYIFFGKVIYASIYSVHFFRVCPPPTPLAAAEKSILGFYPPSLPASLATGLNGNETDDIRISIQALVVIGWYINVM